MSKNTKNPNPITKRKAVKISATLASPALIGSGESENTDSDVLIGYDGTPYLPGTSLAGVMRSKLPDDDAGDLFGDDVMRGKRMSALWVMDSKFVNPKIIELDGVALNYENKVAKKGEKYDYEAVERGTTFTVRLMLVIREKDDGEKLERLLNSLLSEFISGNVGVGAKTNRGFGRVECKADDILYKTFDFKEDGKKALADYERFKWSDVDGWEEAKDLSDANTLDDAITYRLRLKGGIMIRDARNIVDGEDYRHISSPSPLNNEPEPVIYGTSWAGAFRSGLYKLLKPKYKNKTAEYLNNFFGYVDKNTGKPCPSKIKFDMSILEKETNYDGFRTVTRVKIDRFTGGAVDGALFKETPWYGGTTTLTARYPKGCNEIKSLLYLAIDALDKGILTVGGETAIGRGVFKLIKEGSNE